MIHEKERIMLANEITVPNFGRSRKFGWGWTTSPTGQGTSIEIPTSPDYTGTLGQLRQDRADDRAFHSLGGAFYNTAWFYGGRRITHTWAFGPLSPMFDENDQPNPDVEYDYRWEPGFHPGYAESDDIKLRLA